MARKFFVGANWKANGTTEKIKALCSSWVRSTDNGASIDGSAVEIMVAAPYLYVGLAQGLLPPAWKVAAQNSWVGKGGAFTGEIPAEMLVDLGVEWVVLGHSERRHGNVGPESDDVVAQKVEYATGLGVGVVLCIGELLEEREAGKTMEVCIRQLQAVKEKLEEKAESWKKIVIAYEPVWAIGTGKVATPEQAQEVHAEIRAWLKKELGEEVGETTRIIYGGSVKPANAGDLSKKPDIDGFLVGGASLKPDFVDIVMTYELSSSA